MPMERVEETADQCSGWLVQELQRWQTEYRQIEALRAGVPREKRSQMADDFVRALGETGKPRDGSKL